MKIALWSVLAFFLIGIGCFGWAWWLDNGRSKAHAYEALGPYILGAGSILIAICILFVVAVAWVILKAMGS